MQQSIRGAALRSSRSPRGGHSRRSGLSSNGETSASMQRSSAGSGDQRRRIASISCLEVARTLTSSGMGIWAEKRSTSGQVVGLGCPGGAGSIACGARAETADSVSSPSGCKSAAGVPGSRSSENSERTCVESFAGSGKLKHDGATSGLASDLSPHFFLSEPYDLSLIHI